MPDLQDMAGSTTVIASFLLVACTCCIFLTGETSGPSLGLLVAKAPKGKAGLAQWRVKEPRSLGLGKSTKTLTSWGITGSVTAAKKELMAGWMLTLLFSLSF